MTRPLLSRTVEELWAAVDRNKRDRAELLLVLQELRFRKTARARAVEARAKAYVAEIEKGSGTAAIPRAPAEPVPSAPLPPSDAGKYAAVHAAATARGSPVVLGWKHAGTTFHAGADGGHGATSVYGTIRRICREAGAEGIGAAELATELRKRQVGNTRSHFCDGLPPIGWAEGWIDTAVTSGLIAGRPTSARAATPPAPPAPPPPPPAPRKHEPMTDARRWTEEAVAALRTKLIDLSKKNPLISFKHGGRSASILRIVDERPDLLCAAIEARPVGFEPLPGEEETPSDELTPTFRIAYERARLTDEAFLGAIDGLGDEERDAKAWQAAERALRASVRRQLGLPLLDYGKVLDVAAIARAHGFDPSYDLKASDDEDVAAHHQDDRLRVLLTAKELDKRLKTIWERYGGHLRETGLDTLFLAIGFVEWFEEAAPETALHAPLLLLPVKLDRAIVRGRYEYRLARRDDPLAINVALNEKMRRDWALDLPALRDDETPESYFVRVGAVLARGRRLALRRYVTLAVLPPTILWEDLDPEVWPEAAFAKHRLLPGLVGAAQIAGEAAEAETIDIDAPEWAAAVPALIRPADASQHSALIDMASGHDLAIEGPPGTGKSETITNMIATAIAAGKKVLFVAEKQAALRVVADRLRASGFGPLLLELHGDTANRTDVYKGLHERLETRIARDPQVLDSQRLQVAQQRTLLRRYLSLITHRLGALGRTAYWLVWREIRLRKEFASELVEVVAALWQASDARMVDQAMLAERRSALDTFGAALVALDGDGDRTRWTAAAQLDPFDQRGHLAAARDAAAAARAMHDAARVANAVAPIGLPGPDGPIAAAVAQLVRLMPFDAVREVVAGAALRYPDTARALLRQQTRWRQIEARLGADLASPASVTSSATTELVEAMVAIASLPATVAEARERLARTRHAQDLATQMAADVAWLGDRLALDRERSTADVVAALDGLAALYREPAAVIALYRSDLLDPLAEATLDAEHRRAQELRRDRDTLRASVTEEALEADSVELQRLAETLADSGLFARLFGGEYKTASRRADRLVEGRPDRAATADLLRRAGRLVSQAGAFRSGSGVAVLFPPVLWRGIDSDWDAIERARAVLTGSRRRLSDAKADDVLRHWLELAADERSRVGALAERVLPPLREAIAAGFGGVPAARLADALGHGGDLLDRLVLALAEVGALPDAQIVRDGTVLAERIAPLLAAAEEFTSLQRSAGFEWVGDVGADLEELTRALTGADALHAAEGPLAILPALVGSETPSALLADIIAAGERWLAAERTWSASRSRLIESAGLVPEPLGDTWEELADALDALASDMRGARLAADLKKYEQALDGLGLAALGEAALNSVAPAERLADLYELLLTRDLLRAYLGGDGAELGRTGGLTLARARSTFTRLDKELHELEAKAIVASRLGDKPPRGVGSGPKGSYTDMELLSSELALKRPRTPIRDVVHRAGAALQMLKPVWMMSPTSVAQYIRPGTLRFDLLVVDEASQMRPEYAVSTVLRGDQFVVVGDANQLPPSDHFQMSGEFAADDDDQAGIVENTESILDLANQRFRRKRRLKWHYRSQHESLIQFSNRQFYQGQLVVFPSPMGNDDELLGVKCRYVEGAVYEASINQREAEAVIEEAFRLMRAYPAYSIGIAAMNAKQTELIQNEFERLVLEQPDVRRYVDEYAGGVDEFFIKNLENVQGDERDIILISTVYGPNKDGRVLQNFGLMNRGTGWRRLNVLVTRAKLSTRLFTSLRPDDVKVTPTSSRGVRTLRDYLTFAHGGASYHDASGGEPDSDFEVFVADALRDAGYEVVHQVGVENFRIDLGVRHANCPLGFIAGIECDGASFHRGLTVRDRDRIRQSVLERMGWKIYRIWSTDWFADPERELRRLLAFLAVQRGALAVDMEQASTGTIASTPDERPAASPSTTAETPDASAVAAVVDSFAIAAPEPHGRAMRPLDDISWFETVQGRVYAIWLGDRLAGEVEVLSRATAAPRIYGNQVVVARSEYEGTVDATGERFRLTDIHATVREVARRARQANAGAG